MKTINDTTKTTETAKAPRFSFYEVLTLIFIVLKLTGNISWSWVWVLAPLWIKLILIVIAILLTAIAVAIKKSDKEN